MSLHMLLPPDAATALRQTWTDKPELLRLPDHSPIPHLLGRPVLDDLIDTACIPTDRINIIKDAVGLDPRHYTDRGRLTPTRVHQARNNTGCTLHIRHLEQFHPPAAALCQALQAETNCTSYVSAFITPAGSQGLQWHWDQALGVIVQLEGTKQWQLWRPTVEAPMLDYLSPMDPKVWNRRWIQQWKQAGPDAEYTLTPGDVLILPRGWIHNPHSLHSPTESVHLTFVLRDRTPHWIAERLIDAAISDPRFRKSLPPASLDDTNMADAIDDTRKLLADYLAGLKPAELAASLRTATIAERDPDA